jgi:Negative regulator of sigma F
MITSSRADLKQRVLAAVRQMPSGVRADARSDARGVFATAAALSMGLFLGFDGVSHSAGRPPWFLATTLVAWTFVAVISARGAWRWGGSFAPGSGLQLATIAVGTPALLMAISLALARLSPLSASVPAGSGLPCLALTFAAALYPLAGVFLLRRSSDPMHPTAGGAALGAASGAMSGVMVAWWCPVTDAAHVLSAHVMPVAVLVVVGAITGDRILAMRGDAVIAKRFDSCDVPLVGDRGAGDCSRSVGLGYDEGGGGHRDP